jgi:hypothetical protein
MKAIERSVGRRWMRAAVVAAVLLIGVTPSFAAETLLGRVTVYEVTEALQFKGPRAATDPSELTRRLAHASLLGTQVEAGSPNAIFTPGMYVTADASSNVSLVTLVGPVRGTLTLLTDLDPARLSLDTLVISSALEIRGQLDLTTAATSGIAGIAGQWNKDRGSRRQGGRFEGVFLIPFQVPGLPGYWYIDPASVLANGGEKCDSPVPGLCPLDGKEFALGIPLTKAVVNFYSR